ncbi:MAG: hypothetical protein ACLGJB_19050 [Blastocatellia bacterium]
MQADNRTRLAEAQSELARALMGGGRAPAGFEHSRFTAASDALLMKRARGVACSWPAMSAALGERFYERFARYARESRIPREGGPPADGRLFAAALALAGELPEEARLEALAFDARYAARADGFISRKGFSVKVARLKQPPRLVIVIRHTRLGERWLRVPLAIPPLSSPR